MKRKMSEEHKQKISQALKGRRPKNLDRIHAERKGKPRPHKAGKNSPNWKGENAAYTSKHGWMRRNYGTPNLCEKCGTTSAKKYEWHNLSGSYRRERSDWQRLCVSCHRTVTFQQEGYEPWNKGQKIKTNTGRTHIKKGQHLSKVTEFKKGQIPFNKYLEPRACLHCGNTFQPREANRKYCSRNCYWASLRDNA